MFVIKDVAPDLVYVSETSVASSSVPVLNKTLTSGLTLIAVEDDILTLRLVVPILLLFIKKPTD